MSTVSARPDDEPDPAPHISDPPDLVIEGMHVPALRALVARYFDRALPVRERQNAAFALVGSIDWLLRNAPIPPAGSDTGQSVAGGSGSRVGAADGAATRSALEAGPDAVDAGPGVEAADPLAEFERRHAPALAGINARLDALLAHLGVTLRD